MSHDYVGHGTTTLFGTLDIAPGTASVIGQCKPRHRHQEFLSFLRHVDCNVLANFYVPLIIDDDATRKHAKVEPWVANGRATTSKPRRPTSRGSTRSSVGWASSPNKPSAAARSRASRNW